MTPHPIYVTLGERIRARREKLGMSQVQLATRCGMVQTQICRIELARGMLTVHNLGVVARALRMPAGDLLRGIL